MVAVKSLSALVGYFDYDSELDNAFDPAHKVNAVSQQVGDRTIHLIKGFLAPIEVSGLLQQLDRHPQIDVGKDGYANNYHEGNPVCSGRSTLYSDYIAGIMSERVGDILPNIDKSHYGITGTWVKSGINPAMRLIDYRNEGFLVPHYDFPYRDSNSHLSLYSLVVFLTSNEQNGSTRFIREYRKNDDSDWDRAALDNEVLWSTAPEAGSALLFPHDMLHESQMTKGRKAVLRTDVMFRKNDEYINKK